MSERVNVIVALNNTGGQLDSRVIEDAAEEADDRVRAAVIELVESVPFFSVGDTITIQLQNA
jgi:hypothetical protein